MAGDYIAVGNVPTRLPIAVAVKQKTQHQMVSERNCQMNAGDSFFQSPLLEKLNGTLYDLSIREKTRMMRKFNVENTGAAVRKRFTELAELKKGPIYEELLFDLLLHERVCLTELERFMVSDLPKELAAVQNSTNARLRELGGSVKHAVNEAEAAREVEQILNSEAPELTKLRQQLYVIADVLLQIEGDRSARLSGILVDILKTSGTGGLETLVEYAETIAETKNAEMAQKTREFLAFWGAFGPG